MVVSTSRCISAIRYDDLRTITRLLTNLLIGGNDPMQATTAWLDRYFGMGLSVRSMIPMYDCPPESVYLPASTYTASGTIRVEKAMCIFEQDTGRPLTRHFGWKKGEFGAVKSYVLTIRSISTVGK